MLDANGNTGLDSIAFNIPRPFTNGLVSWWRGDGDATDSIDSNSASGTIGTPQFMPGRYREGMKFDGNSGFIVNDNANLDFGAANSFSLDAWVRVDDVPINSSVLVEKRQQTGPTGYSLALEGTSAGALAGRLGFVIQTDNTSGFATLDTTSSIADGMFHHIAVVVDRSTNVLSLYLDGLLQGTASTSGVGDISNTGRFFIGHNSQDIVGSSGVPFNGLIDELGIFDRALSAAEVQAIAKGPRTISPTSALPPISGSLTIDGYTQPGASPNALTVGDNAVLLIAIDARPSNLSSPLLEFSSGNQWVVRGLDLELNAQGIVVDNGNPTSQLTIAGNFIGTDPTGSTAAFGSGEAIRPITGTGDIIGGTAPADRNVIVGGGDSVIDLAASSGSIVQGNYIGVNAAGTAALTLSSRDVIVASNVGSNMIGGPAPGAGNVIVGGFRSTVFTVGPNTTIQGNFIGTNATGTAGLGGSIGIYHNDGANNTIDGNLISGVGTGIFEVAGSSNNVIRGNKIGTDVTGTHAIGNIGNGIVLRPGFFFAVGGTSAGDGNLIAFNGGAGVLVDGGSGSASILGNSIHDNGALGINLSGGTENSFGVTTNDPGDGDTGPNSLQNFPVLTSAVTVGGGTTITGTLNSTLNTTFRVEFFASNVADPSGFGEGQFFLGFTNVTTDGSGNGGFTVTLPVGAIPGQVVSATATDPAGNTSEFSHVAPGPTVLSTQVNDGSAQRSRVTSLSVTFSAQVTFAGTVASAFTLTRSGGGAVSFQASASVVNGVTVVTLDNFTGSETEFGSFKDGRYTLTALANQITLGGQQLDGNGDGTPGDNYAFGDAQGLFRMFGDVNGDQVVNGFDLGLFRNTFGTAAGDPNYLSYFDFNGDGVINGFDLGQLRTRFGTMLP
jgi:hypothetical protein